MAPLCPKRREIRSVAMLREVNWPPPHRVAGKLPIVSPRLSLFYFGLPLLKHARRASAQARSNSARRVSKEKKTSCHRSQGLLSEGKGENWDARRCVIVVTEWRARARAR